jgi:hypothetical protein
MDRAQHASRMVRLLMADSVNLGFSVTSDEMGSLMKALESMQAKSVFAGFPQEEEPRKDAEGSPEPITNAAIAYAQNTGMPEQNIPARPFMEEGVETVGDKIADGMESAGVAALDGDVQGVDMALHAVGLTAKLGIQNKILDGPFDPLADSTLKARARRGRQGAQNELDRREAGEAPGTELARPLNDTGQMRNAVNYVIREE